MTVTTSPYATSKDVERFLLLEHAIDAHSPIADHDVDRFIIQAAGEWEDETGTAYRPVWVDHEIHDVQSLGPRHHELFGGVQFALHRPFRLHHGPILPMDADRGHRIDVFEGSDGTFTDANPHGEWTNYITERTQGRTGTWWVDDMGRTVWVRKAILVRRNALLRFSYEWGKPITTTTGAVAADATTIPLLSAYRYQRRGYVRIGEEWIFHTGISGTSLTGCVRGKFGTTPEAHDSGSEVYEVPENVWRLIVMRAAALYMGSQQFIVTAGEGGGSGMPMEKAAAWNREWTDALRRYGRGPELV